MSEYIVELPYGGVADEAVKKFGIDDSRLYGYQLTGEIVRCRDCVHYHKHKWFEVVVGTPLGTDISDVCMFFADGCKVEPDGFCAWGERKEGGDD